MSRTRRIHGPPVRLFPFLLLGHPEAHLHPDPTSYDSPPVLINAPPDINAPINNITPPGTLPGRSTIPQAYPGGLSIRPGDNPRRPLPSGAR